MTGGATLDVNTLDSSTGGLGMAVITLTRVGKLTVMIVCVEVVAGT
jgi:hypothetical protein